MVYHDDPKVRERIDTMYFASCVADYALYLHRARVSGARESELRMELSKQERETKEEWENALKCSREILRCLGDQSFKASELLAKLEEYASK